MKPETRHRLLFIITDFILTSVAWFTFSLFRFYTLEDAYYDLKLGSYLLWPTVLIGQLVIPLGMMGLYWLSGFYNNTFSKSRLEVFTATLSSVFIGAIFIYFGAIIDDPIPDRLSNYVLISILFSLLLCLVATGRLIVTSLIRREILSGRLARNMLIVGSPDSAAYCFKRLNKDPHLSGIKLCGIVTTSPSLTPFPSGQEVIDIAAIDEYCRTHTIDGLILATDRNNPDELLKLVRELYLLNLPLLMPSWSSFTPLARFNIKQIVGEPLTYISSPSFTESGRNIKRTVDIIVSALALVILSPLLAILAIAVKRSSPGPVFYKQERIGRNRVPFTIYKFRTMYHNSEPSGPTLSHDGDPRITPLGHFMRKYRLDELPQFWNILKGDMSLVGPRPEREHFEKMIIARAPEYTLLHQLRPGLTSWGMVKYGYASNVDQMIERLDYDMIYLDNISLLVDLKIIFYTIRTVVTGKGI